MKKISHTEVCGPQVTAYKLVFWEAKLYANINVFNGKVIGQIDRYANQIIKWENEIIELFRVVSGFQYEIAKMRSTISEALPEHLRLLAEGKTELNVERWLGLPGQFRAFR